jgi:hypothetical protein
MARLETVMEGHSEAVKNKRGTQAFALSRVTAKTWEPGMIRVREICTKCIRSAVVFGAASNHTPIQAGGKPKGITASSRSPQSRAVVQRNPHLEIAKNL